MNKWKIQKRTPLSITKMPSSSSHVEALQRRTCADWAQREYVELISGSIKRIADFLNAFDCSVRGRLSALDEKLTRMERKVDYLEARIAVNNDGQGDGGADKNAAGPNTQMETGMMPDESEA